MATREVRSNGKLEFAGVGLGVMVVVGVGAGEGVRVCVGVGIDSTTVTFIECEVESPLAPVTVKVIVNVPNFVGLKVQVEGPKLLSDLATVPSTYQSKFAAEKV